MTRTDPTPTLAAETLLEHADWLRRLAGVLVLEPGGADDVAQETWIAALKSPPAGGREPRAWLATVARNAARRQRRATARRAEREARAARPEATPATDEVVARAALSRRVVDEVLSLDEPYRSTLLLRYFDDLSAREIARRLERPVNTVRTHLERGMALLRRRLDGEFGDRESWCVALLPLLPEGSVLAARGAVAWSLGGFLMSWKLLAPLALAIVALIAWRADDPGPPTAADPHGLLAEAEPAGRPGAAKSGVERAPAIPVEPARSSANERALEAAGTAVAHLHAGQVFDLEGAPVRGLRLQFAEARRPARDEHTARTAADGRFALERVARFDAAQVRVTADGYRSTGALLTEVEGGARVFRLERIGADEHYVVDGVVLDAQGLAAAGVGVSFGNDETASDADGRFALRVRYVAEHDDLLAWRQGFAPALLEDLGGELLERPEVGRELVLRLGAETWSLAGQVVDLDGNPRGGVIVELVDGVQHGTSNLLVEGLIAGRGAEDVVTDADGRFLHGGLFRERYMLRARDPATFLCAVAADVPAGSEELELVLDETRLLPEVRGVVVDRAGRPVGGAMLGLTVDRIGCLDGGACLQSTLDLGTSDEHGRFALQGVAHEHVRLSVRGEGVESAQFELESHQATALELTVGLELRFRLGETFPARADAVEARDERDAPLTLTGILPDVTSLIRRLPLGGRFARAKLEVSDAAVELVYLAGDEVLARRPLELRRGEVVVVE